MSEKLTITPERLIQVRDEIEKVLVMEHGRGFEREVRYHVGAREFRVIDHGETVLVTMFADKAAEEFNAIPPR